MDNRAYGLRLWLALAVVGMLGISVCVRAAERMEAAATRTAAVLSEADQELLDLLQKGVRQYESNKLSEARETFERILAMQPSSRVALQMREKAEIGLFVKMQTQKEDPELAGAAEKLLEMMTAAVVHKKRDVGDIEKVLADYESKDMKRYVGARAQLIGHGPYAVPYLLQFLTTQEAEKQLVVGRTIGALSQMPRDACLPLIEALADDDAVLKTRVAGVLGQMGDLRALAPLAALAEDDSALEPVVEAAQAAIKNITGKSPEQLPGALAQYRDVVGRFLVEDGAAVGHIFGEWIPLWSWSPAGQQMHDKLTYELLPAYLYYQRAGAEFALKGLKLAPDDAELKSLLLTLLCRQYTLVGLAARGGAGKDMQQDAQKRLADLERRVATVGHLYDSDVVGMALKRALALKDADASLILVKLLGRKAGVEAGEGAEALLAALDATDKDVRYQASIEIVKRSPSGKLGQPTAVMEIMSAALKYAAAKNALLVLNDLQLRNKLAAAVRKHQFTTTECNASAGSIDKYLNLQPGVDIVFLSGNLPQAILGNVLEKLKSDARTKAVPLYVVVDAQKEAADLSGAEGISRVLSSLEVRDEKLEPILKAASVRKLGPSAAERGDVVLLAATTLQRVDPASTEYPLAMLESSLVSALRGYGEPVQMAAVKNLDSFGSEKSLEPLAELAAASGPSDELKAAACRAVAAVARRSGAKLSPTIVKALRSALSSDVQTLKNAAAEALGVAGIPADELRGIVESYATPARVAAP